MESDECPYSKWSNRLLGSTSAFTGTWATLADLSVVGLPVGVPLGSISTVTGAISTAIDCGANNKTVTCVLGIVSISLGPLGTGSLGHIRNVAKVEGILLDAFGTEVGWLTFTQVKEPGQQHGGGR